MNINIWGNVFLYCMEKDIDFYEVLCKVEENTKQRNKELMKTPMYKQKQTNTYIPCVSTLELDIDVLVNQIHIPLKEIFDPDNREQRIIDVSENKGWACGLNSFYFYKKNSCILWEMNGTIICDGIGYQKCISLDIGKYLDLETMSTEYNMTVNFTSQYVPDKKGDGYYKPDLGIYSKYFSGNGFVLYHGESEKIAKYIDTIIRYNEDQIWYDEEENEVSITDYRIIDFNDIVIKSSIQSCEKNRHTTYIVNAVIFLLDAKTYDIKHEVVPLLYCQTCDVYFMYDNVYNSLMLKGRPLLHVNSYKFYQYRYMHQDHPMSSLDEVAFTGLNRRSKFNICGYTVNAVDNIPDEGRHHLLDFLIKRKTVTVMETTNFINWLINTRKNDPKMQDAIKKWQNDLVYIFDTYQNRNYFVLVR